MIRTIALTVTSLSLALSAGAAEIQITPLELEPLPVGSVMPDGWLKTQLDQMTEGLCGRLYEHSSYLTPSNGWLQADRVGWEEQPYWFRGFIKVAILTGNERMLGISRDWVEKILATQDADGWYGPSRLKAHTFKNKEGETKVISDIWGHMVMNEALMTWYQHTGDRRILDLLLKFYRYLTTMDEMRLLPSAADRAGCGNWTWNIQVDRAGDAIPTIIECYDLTKEAWLLPLAARIWRHRSRPGLFMHHHNVNFAQLFGYGTVLSRLTHREADRASAAFWFDLHMKAWGATPRCGFAGDEHVRFGCYDARYGTETCTWAEFVRSFGLVSEVTGDTVWGDRTEDVVFNWYPISYTPGWTELHYITAGNQVNLDAQTDHNYFDPAPMAAYSSQIYRCCRHNAHFGLPLFCESLVRKSRTGDLVFWLYAPHHGATTLANGTKASWRMDTEYPFRETARLTFDAAVPSVRFRVPGWCRRFEVKEGDRTLAATEQAGGWLTLRDVRAGAVLDLSMKAECTWREYPRNGGLSVERGPLTYSLAIEPQVACVPRPSFKKGADGILWPEPPSPELAAKRDKMTEMRPKEGTKWNYALDRTATLEYRTLPFATDCFRYAAAPAEILVKGRLLPEWTLQDNQPAELQDSPAYTEAPLETLRFIPMCCARLHVTVFPAATTDAVFGNRWHTVPAATSRKERSNSVPTR